MSEREAAQWYERLHGGLAPEWRAQPVEVPRWLGDLGPLASVTYLRHTPRGVEAREHVFAPHARPTLARTDSGQLAVVDGRYHVTERGIMDHTGLALRDGRAGFTAITAQRYTPAGVPVHGRQTPREGVMVPRANPLSVADLREGGERIGGAVVAGGACLVLVAASDALVERTSWCENTRAAVQGVGLVVAGSGMCLTGAVDVGRGAIAAGITAAGLRYVRSRGWDRAIAARLASLFGSVRPEERSGGALWDESADVRVEAMATA